MNSVFEVHPIEPAQDGAWRSLLAHHPMARSIVPAWDTLSGWHESRHGVFERGELVGGIVMSTQRIPLSPLSLSRINCMMIGPERTSEMLSAMLSYVERHARRHAIVETEVRIRIPTVTNVRGFEDHATILSGFADYQTLKKVDTTYFVPIDLDDASMMARCDRHTRRKIRSGYKANVTVEIAENFDLLDTFCESYMDMCYRKDVPVLPANLVGRGLLPLLEDQRALLFIERYDDLISNMVIVDTLGIPCYVIGTRTRANVEGRVPGAGQVLHHEIMRTLRDRGHVWYDLGGCEGPVPIEAHHNFGVWRFKYGFGGQFVRFIPYLRRIRGPFQRVLALTHQLRGDFV